MRPNGAIFKENRLRLGMSQVDVAFAADVSRRTVQNVEASKEGVKSQSVTAIAKVVEVDPAEVFLLSADAVSNGDSFAFWPWRLFEFVSLQTVPSEAAICQSRTEAMSVVAEMWKCWQIHASELNPEVLFSGSQSKHRQRAAFVERYMGLWDANPLTLMCSSANGKRTGVSVLLPVGEDVYSSFRNGKRSPFDITSDDLMNESQSLVYDAMMEFTCSKRPKWHHVTNSLGFISFYQLAALSTNTLADDFRLASYAADAENVDRMKRAGMELREAVTPDFGQPIVEFCGTASDSSSDPDMELSARGSTSAHYASLLKRLTKARIKTDARRALLRAYQLWINDAQHQLGHHIESA